MNEKVIQRASQYRLTIYVQEQDEDTVKDFIELSRRQGTSASAQIIDYIRSQLPQSQAKADEVEVHSCYKCGLVSDFLYHFRGISGRRLWACEEHFKLAEEKGLIRVVIKRPTISEGKANFNPNLSFAKPLKKPNP